MSDRCNEQILSKRELIHLRASLVKEAKQRYHHDTAFIGGRFENVFRAVARDPNCMGAVLFVMLFGALLSLFVSASVCATASLFGADWWSISEIFYGSAIVGAIVSPAVIDTLEYLAKTQASRQALREELELIRARDAVSLFSDWCTQELDNLQTALRHPADIPDMDVGQLEQNLETLEKISDDTDTDVRKRKERFRDMIRTKISALEAEQQARDERLAWFEETSALVRSELETVEGLTSELAHYETSMSSIPDVSELIRETQENRAAVCCLAKARIHSLRESLEQGYLPEEDD